MKNVLLFFVVCISCLSVCTRGEAQRRVLSNVVVLQMVKSGMSDDAIIAEIKTKPSSAFSVSASDIQLLKDNGVSEAVINAVSAAYDLSNGTVGAFWKRSDSEWTKLMGCGVIKKPRSGAAGFGISFGGNVLGSIIGGRDGNVLGGVASTAGLFYSVFPGYRNGVIQGGSSNVVVDTCLPEFFFYFSSNNEKSCWYNNVSPNDFVLVKVSSRGDYRYLPKSLENFDPSNELPLRIVALKIEQVNSYTYKIRPKSSLRQGNYCFVYVGNNSDVLSNPMVFDFTIK